MKFETPPYENTRSRSIALHPPKKIIKENKKLNLTHVMIKPKTCGSKTRGGKSYTQNEKNFKKQESKEKKKKEDPFNFQSLFDHVTATIKKQDETVERVCNAMCSYLAFLKGEYFENPRILLHGPSGCGKTAIVSEIAQKLGLPFFSIDASSLTGAGYKGQNLTQAIDTILFQCEMKGYNAHEIVIFFDEIDKLFLQLMTQDSTPGSVISELLVFLTEGNAELNFSTKRCLIIFAGAFGQVNLLQAQKFSKEFFGRIPTQIGVKRLKFEDFKTILLTSKGSPLVQMQEEFKKMNRSLTLTDEAVDYIAKYSVKRETGSRAVKSAMHDLLQPYFGKYKDVPDITITLDACKKLFDEFMNDDSDQPPRGMYL